MKRLLQIVMIAVLSATLMSSVGCVHKRDLDPAGVYDSDILLYAADRTITTAYSSFDTFLKWERDNRVTLRKWPEIKQGADYIRANAKTWIETATALRDTYKIAPTETNRKSLESGLAVLRSALDQAAAYYALRAQKQ